MATLTLIVIISCVFQCKIAENVIVSIVQLFVFVCTRSTASTFFKMTWDLVGTFSRWRRCTLVLWRLGQKAARPAAVYAMAGEHNGPFSNFSLNENANSRQILNK